MGVWPSRLIESHYALIFIDISIHHVTEEAFNFISITVSSRTYYFILDSMGMVIDNGSSLSILLGLMVILVLLSNELLVIGIQYINSIILSLFSFKMMISMDHSLTPLLITVTMSLDNILNELDTLFNEIN